MKKTAEIVHILYEHKFHVICVAFVVYMVFFYDYSLVRLIKLDDQAAELKAQINDYRDTIAHFEQRIQEMNNASEELDRYAREKLHMHASNEDLYIFED